MFNWLAMSDIISDWQRTFDILSADVLQAAAQVDNRSDGWAKRSYVRAVFAVIEGTTFGMKRLALNIWDQDQRNLDADELELLHEKRLDAQAKGRKHFPAFGENIKLTFQVFAKAYRFKSLA